MEEIKQHEIMTNHDAVKRQISASEQTIAKVLSLSTIISLNLAIDGKMDIVISFFLHFSADEIMCFNGLHICRSCCFFRMIQNVDEVNNPETYSDSCLILFEM